MASTYSALKIELIATGEQSGTWGATTNVNLGDAALGEAITGSADVAFSSADVTVSLIDTNTTQTARNLRLNLTGTSGGARNLILGSGCQIEKLYLVNNGLADAVTVKNTTGTGIAVAAGKSMFVYNNGTNVVEAVNSAISMAVTGAISGTTIGGTTITAATQFTGPGTGLTGTAASLTVGTATNATNVTGTIASAVTGTTQTAGDNSTKIATTAYVATAVAGGLGTLGTMSTQNANNVAITGGTINGTTIGATTATTGRFTTVTSTIATGTAPFTVTSTTPVANLSIGGNAATATSATTATNLAGGAAYRVPYQSGVGTTTFVTAPTVAETALTWDGSALGWSTVAAASANGCVYENGQTITSNYTMTTNKNGMSVGPITVDTGVTVTIPTGSNWVIL